MWIGSGSHDKVIGFSPLKKKIILNKMLIFSHKVSQLSRLNYFSAPKKVYAAINELNLQLKVYFPHTHQISFLNIHTASCKFT